MIKGAMSATSARKIADMAPLILAEVLRRGDAMDRAVAHGGEHVINFTDTAVELVNRTGDPEALVAAVYVGELIR
jgi:hypothetical protein